MILVTVRYTKKVQADTAALDRFAQPMIMGVQLARHIRERVELRGETATPAKPYLTEQQRVAILAQRIPRAASRVLQAVVGNDVKRVRALQKYHRSLQRQVEKGKVETPYTVSEPYAKQLGLDTTVFRSSDDFHRAAGVKLGTSHVTGGMWQGLQVRNKGASQVSIDFDNGSTLGAKRAGETTPGGRTRKSQALRVRNSAKASTVFAFMGYSPIAPTDSEQAALQTVAVRWSQLAVCHVLGGEPTRFEPVGDSRLVQSILSSFDPTR